jgi:hypothetical protein
MDELWKTLHVLAGFGLVAGIVGRTVTISAARRSNDLRSLETLMATAGRFEDLLVKPGSFAVVLLGLFTMWAQGRGLVGEGDWWLLTSLLIFVGIGLLVPFVFLPRGKVFGRALEEAKAEGQVTPALTTALDDPAVRAARITEAVGLVVIVVLMVTQPF